MCERFVSVVTGSTIVYVAFDGSEEEVRTAQVRRGVEDQTGTP